MTFTLFASLFFVLLSLLQQTILSPLRWILNLHTPGWFGLTVLVLLLSWCLGDE